MTGRYFGVQFLIFSYYGILQASAKHSRRPHKHNFATIMDQKWRVSACKLDSLKTDSLTPVLYSYLVLRRDQIGSAIEK
jgi:hypothetical protein